MFARKNNNYLTFLDKIIKLMFNKNWNYYRNLNSINPMEILIQNKKIILINNIKNKILINLIKNAKLKDKKSSKIIINHNKEIE